MSSLVIKSVDFCADSMRYTVRLFSEKPFCAYNVSVHINGTRAFYGTYYNIDCARRAFNRRVKTLHR